MLFPALRAHGFNPPNPLGLAERVPRPQAVEGVPSRYLHRTGFTRRSKPSVLPPITYRGFAIAPITLRSLPTILARSPVPSPKTSLFEGGGPPAGGGRSSRTSRPYHPSHVLSKPLIQPRVQGRNPARFNGGYGVPRGFKGGSKSSAPCGRLSEAEHPKRKGATLLRPLSAVNRNRPGNSHSRASAPCDFRFPPCFFPRCGRMASIPLIP